MEALQGKAGKGVEGSKVPSVWEDMVIEMGDACSISQMAGEMGVGEGQGTVPTSVSQAQREDHACQTPNAQSPNGGYQNMMELQAQSRS